MLIHPARHILGVGQVFWLRNQLHRGNGPGGPRPRDNEPKQIMHRTEPFRVSKKAPWIFQMLFSSPELSPQAPDSAKQKNGATNKESMKSRRFQEHNGRTKKAGGWSIGHFRPTPRRQVLESPRTNGILKSGIIRNPLLCQSRDFWSHRTQVTSEGTSQTSKAN